MILLRREYLDFYTYVFISDLSDVKAKQKPRPFALRRRSLSPLSRVENMMKDGVGTADKEKEK